MFAYLERAARERHTRDIAASGASVTNLVIGNNMTAVAAAGMEAERLGYTVAAESTGQSEGAADEIGRQLAERVLNMRNRRFAVSY